MTTMAATRRFLGVVLLSLTLAPSASSVGTMRLVRPSIHASAVALPAAVEALPVTFEPNRGQADARVRFVAHGSAYTLFLTFSEAVLALSPMRGFSPDSWPVSVAARHTGRRRLTSGVDRRNGVLRIHFVGANRHPQIVGLHQLSGTANYLVGGGPRSWHTSVPTYAAVEFRNIYPLYVECGNRDND